MNENVHQALLFSLAAVSFVRASFGAGTYDGTTGYVTLTSAFSDENSLKYYNVQHTYYDGFNTDKQKWCWSDEQKPHAETNYYVKAGVSMIMPRATFKGHRLVVAGGLRPYGIGGETDEGKATVSNLTLLAGSCVDVLKEKGVFICDGDWTIESTEESPFHLVGGREGHTYDIRAALNGAATAAIVIEAVRWGDGHKPPICQTSLAGPTTNYFGSVIVSTNEVLTLGKQGLEHATLTLDGRSDDTILRMDAPSGTVIPVKTLCVKSGRIALRVDNTLAVGELILPKNGRLTFDMTALAASRKMHNVGDAFTMPKAGSPSIDRFDFVNTDRNRAVWLDGGDKWILRVFSELTIGTRIANTEYGSATGYVTHTNGVSETSLNGAGGYTANQSFTNGYAWIGATAPELNSETNYFAFSIGGMAQAFKGKSLTLGGMLRPYVNSAVNACVIDDFRLLPGASLDACGTVGTYIFDGNMSILSTAESPLKIGGGAIRNGQCYIVNAALMGDRDASILITEDSSVLATRTYQCQTKFLGDTTRYFGAVTVSSYQTLILGDCGLPNVKSLTVDVPEAELKTAASAGGVVKTGPIVWMANGSTVEVAAGNVLHPASLSVTGTLTKTGAGDLIVGGEAVAGAGAKIVVSSGSLGASSAKALAGFDLEFAGEASYVRDYNDGADAAVVLSSFPSSLPVKVINIPADVTACRVALFTVATDQADALIASLVIKKIRGYKATLGKGPDDNGMTTVYVDFAHSGLILFVR